MPKGDTQYRKYDKKAPDGGKRQREQRKQALSSNKNSKEKATARKLRVTNESLRLKRDVGSGNKTMYRSYTRSGKSK